MSWLFSQALVEAYLGDTCLDGEPSAPLSGNSTQQAYCAPDKMTKFSRLFRYGMIVKPLTDTRGQELLTLYLEDFHVKTYQQRGGGEELKGQNPQCGNTWQGSLARLDPNTSLWRTAQCSLLEDLELSLQTFPKWGLMQNGALYQLPTLVQTISVKEFGLEPNNETFFHTLNTTGLDGGSNSRKALKKRKNTNQYVTPTARDYKGMGGAGFRSRHGMNHNLADCLGGVPNPMFVEWLMGWPLGWTDLKPLEMDKSLYVQQLHGSYLNE